MRLLQYVIMIIVSVFVISCEKEHPQRIRKDTEMPQLEKKSAFPGEIITINFENDLNSTVYQQNFGNEAIKMIAIGDRLSFKVPSIDNGLHKLVIEIDGLTHSFYLHVKKPQSVEGPNSFLSDFVFDVNEQIDDIKEIQDVMITIDLMDKPILQKDLSSWEKVDKSDLMEKVGGITNHHKQKLANILAVNLDWLYEMDRQLLGQNIYEDASGEQLSKCIQSMKLSHQYAQDKNMLACRGESVHAFWCSIDSISKTKPAKLLSKVAVLWEADLGFDNQILLHTIGRKMDLMAKMIASLAGSPSIAKNIKPSQYVPNQGQKVKFCHNQKKEIDAKVEFRSVRRSSINTSEADATFANFFYDFINDYNDYAKSLQETISWQPSFKKKTREVTFNRYLSIPDSSITNAKVELLNSEYNNHEWQVVLSNKTQTTQHFNCWIVYNDAHAQAKSSYMGKLEHCQP